jgi:hypothetical protein
VPPVINTQTTQTKLLNGTEVTNDTPALDARRLRCRFYRVVVAPAACSFLGDGQGRAPMEASQVFLALASSCSCSLRPET